MSVVALLNFWTQSCLCLLPIILIKSMKVKRLSLLMIKKVNLIHLLLVWKKKSLIWTVITSFSSVTTSSSSREDLTTKLETIRRNFVGNAYNLNQIDVDGIYELEIKRISVWEHLNIKLKRQLKSSLKPIRIVFIGEPAFDTGGPRREFFTLYFDDAARNIMQGTSSSFTLLHDVKKSNRGDFERFGLLIALALTTAP